MKNMLREKFGVFDIYLEGYEKQQHETATVAHDAHILDYQKDRFFSLRILLEITQEEKGGVYDEQTQSAGH